MARGRNINSNSSSKIQTFVKRLVIQIKFHIYADEIFQIFNGYGCEIHCEWNEFGS